MFSPEAPRPSLVETASTTGLPTRSRLLAARVTGVSESPAASRASVAPVLTAVELAALPKGCLIVDLASKPGGTDFVAARRLGHTALHALSLPTVWAPETAGEALARTVQTILQEREERV